MKTYIKPTIDIIKIQTTQLIAASGDTQGATIYDETLDGVTFGSRGMDGDFFDDEE